MLDADLHRARECCQRRAWGEAHQLLSLADQRAPLAVQDLERLATAAYLLGRDIESHRYLERAHHAHLDQGDPPGAARAAFWLSLTLLLRGESAQANGWLARGERLIEGRDCVEHGYLLLPAAEQRLVERNADAAFTAAGHAAEMGARFHDADLTACARHLQGRALIRQERIQPGLGLLDEAMIAVSSGELSPIVTGLIYCSVIDTCQQVFALSRAREWTLALTRWCEQQSELVAFTGTCLVHRAAVMQFQGAWGDAMIEARHACEPGSRPGEWKPPAEALYRQGEIHRLRGEYGAAEEAYRQASGLGSEPQPGFALLRLAQGRTDAAGAALGRVLAAATDPLHRAGLLPAYVEIVLAAGQLEEARSASEELEQIARRYPTDVLHAMAAHARGAVELTQGEAHAALGALRLAFELWQQSEAPYETARARLLIGLACQALGDQESADLELAAARDLFERLGAAPDLARLSSLRAPATRTKTAGLTPRELEVLRRIAAGRTNKAIAAELVLSERTIDRHVSNILTKLGVPSRAAAAAHASTHKLL
jgi:DNA-binding NarL/FixJ family response regulator